MKVQFVGDELRLAFPINIRDCIDKVKRFVDGVFTNLEKSPNDARLKGVILLSDFEWQTYLGCIFFDGTDPVKSADWLNYAEDGEIVINENFKEALKQSGFPALSLTQRQCGNETGFLLRS